MAELFINPLVPLPMTVSNFKLTKNPSNHFVLTSDAQGNGTWEAPPPDVYVSEQTGTVSGPWASPQSITMSFLRWFNVDGIRMSTIFFSNVAATATVNTFATLNFPVPPIYRPLITVAASYPYSNNSTYASGIVSIDTSGTVFFASSTNGSFAASGTTGWFGFSITYRSADFDP